MSEFRYDVSDSSVVVTHEDKNFPALFASVESGIYASFVAELQRRAKRAARLDIDRAPQIPRLASRMAGIGRAAPRHLGRTGPNPGRFHYARRPGHIEPRSSKSICSPPASEVARLLHESAEPAQLHHAAVALLRMLYLHPTEAVADWHPLGVLTHQGIPGSRDPTSNPYLGTAENITFDQAVCPIHDHVWELTSQVLVGSHVNVEMQSETASLDRATHRAASVNYHGATNHIVAHGQGCPLTESGRTTWTVGERYSVPTGELHRTIIPDGSIVATVVSPRPPATIRLAPIYLSAWTTCR